MGFFVAAQKEAELLIEDWSKNEFSKLISFIKKGGCAFQDIPFSLPETFKALDKTFPDAKFILTLRESPEVWYNSVTKFHAKLWGRNGNPPGKAELLRANYIHKGWMWKAHQLIYASPENDPYNKDLLIRHYIKHNEDVVEYFKNRKEKLLILHISDPRAHEKLNAFLNPKYPLKAMPWEHKTKFI